MAAVGMTMSLTPKKRYNDTEIYAFFRDNTKDENGKEILFDRLMYDWTC